MSLQLVTPPALEPVTLADAKAHLKVDTADDDALIGTLITAARARAEWHTGRALIAQSWILWLDAFPDDGVIEVPLPPLKSVDSVTLFDAQNADTAVDTANYAVDTASQPGRIVFGCTYVPPANLRRRNAAAVAFDAGYGSAASDVPADIREAILEIVAGLYVNRGDGPDGEPLAAQALLAPYRVFKL